MSRGNPRVGEVRQRLLLSAALLAAVLCALPARGAEPEAKLLFTLPWGSGDGQVGRTDGEDSSPEGPMSFVVDAQGRFWVLDQVNARVARFDAAGRFQANVPLPAVTYQELCVSTAGQVVVVDRLARRSVDWVGEDGRVQHAVPAQGEHVPEGGGISAAFWRPDGLWLEYNHEVSVRVAERDGQAVKTRTVLAGRPFPGAGVRTAARLAGPDAVELYTAGLEDEVLHAHATLTFEMPLMRIVDLQVDDEGRVVVVVHLWEEAPTPPYAVARETLEVRVLSPQLEELTRFAAPPTVGPWEQFREVVVKGDGTVYLVRCTQAGMEVRQWQR